MKVEIVLKAMTLLLIMGLDTYKGQFGVLEKQISKNGMTVKWEFKDDRVFFQMSAPTKGWLAIGFNDSEQLTGTYLLMGNVVSGNANVVEHYTRKPGDYLPISELGDRGEVGNIGGKETKLGTTLNFSVPIKSKSKFKKHLKSGTLFNLLMAYSREDDFQHHSVMRTALSVNL